MTANSSRRAEPSAVGGTEPTTHAMPQRQGPDDVLPRLVALGASAEAARHLLDRHDQQRIADALDALEELDRDVPNPVGWVHAAVQQRWDLDAVLAGRREREQRLEALDVDRRRREVATAAYSASRAIAERWDAAISAALSDQQLARAVDHLVDDVPGIGRRSVPVARAELVTWAVDVHLREPDRPLDAALGDDVQRGPHRGPAHEWPLPPPPAPASGSGARRLTDRIAVVIGATPELQTDTSRTAAKPSPHREVQLEEPTPRTPRNAAGW